MTGVDDDQRYSIGELSRRTGLSAKTIRFYSDEGLVPPTDRTSAGHRRYDVTAMARLELVRTLRDLGAGLGEVRRVLAAETDLPSLAQRQLQLVEEQLRRLRTRRAVLRAVVREQKTTEEVRLMHKLAQLSDGERDRLIDEFWDSTISGLDIDEQFAEWMRSAKPRLPDDPNPAQVEAWVELAELINDQSFRAAVREMWRRQAERMAAGDEVPVQTPDQAAQWWSLHDDVNAAEQAGTAPDSARGRELAERAARTYAEQLGTADSPQVRGELAEFLAQPVDERMSRYWELLAIINDWPAHPTRQAGMHWLAAAVRGTLD